VTTGNKNNINNNNLSKIISFVTSKGFQIHPDALTLIEKIQDNYFQVIEEILLDKKTKKEKSLVIRTEDIKNVVKISNYNTINENQNSNNNYQVIISESKTSTSSFSSSTMVKFNDKENSDMVEDDIFFSIKKNNLNKYKEEKNDENFKII
jgi:DNA polymerase II small subunit